MLVDCLCHALSDIIHVYSGIRIAAILFLGIAWYLIVYMSHRVNYLHGSNVNLLYKYTYIGLRVSGHAVEGGVKSAPRACIQHVNYKGMALSMSVYCINTSN